MSRLTALTIGLMLFFFQFKVYSQVYSADDVYKNKRIITAIPFLRLMTEARTSAMGNSGAGTPNEANSSITNPSKVPFSDSKSGISLSYIPWLTNLIKGSSISSLSGFTKLNGEYAISSTLRFFKREQVTLYNENEENQGQLRPNEFAFDLSVSRKYGSNFSIGTTLRYISSNLYTVPGSGSVVMQRGQSVAVDIAAFKQFETAIFGKEGAVGLGLCLSNIGPKINYANSEEFKYYLPTNLNIGGSISTFSNDDRFTVALDLNKLMVPSPKQTQGGIDRGIENSVAAAMLKSFTDAQGGLAEELQEIEVSSGIEWALQKRFFLRGGINWQSYIKGDNSYLTLGGGFIIKKLAIDFSYLTASRNTSYLSNTLRISLGMRFN